MRPSSSIPPLFAPAFLIVVLILTPGILNAQLTIEEIGSSGDGDQAVGVFDISADGKVIVGEVTRAGGQRAFRWTDSSGVAELGPFPADEYPRMAKGVSADGSTVVGLYWDTVGSNTSDVAFNWTTSGGLQLLPQYPHVWTMTVGGGTLGLTDALGVSGNDSVIVGQSPGIGDDTTYAFRWTSATGFTDIGRIAASPWAQAVKASFDGSVIAGNGVNGAGKKQAFRWTQSGGITPLGYPGSHDYAEVTDLTPDGEIIVGFYGTDYIVHGSFRWSGASGLDTVPRVPATSGSPVRAYSVSADGRVIVGESGWGAVIWTDGTVWPSGHQGTRYLSEALQTEFGFDLTGWAFQSAYGISDDGRVIAGNGVGPSGLPLGFRLELPFLRLLEPKADSLWIAGEQDTIRWESAGIDTVLLSFSVNYDSSRDTGTFDLIDFDIPADSGYYAWDIPEEIVSKKCVVRIEWQKDSTVADTSNLFRIKGYVLTRDSADQWEPFRFEEDRWNFGNAEPNMWPDGWWSQFDYQAGADPYTLNFYPQDPSYPFHRTKSDSFPDWPLFVQTFGEDQCYRLGTPLLGFYKPSATTRWDAISDEWGGSCSGFSISSLLAFTDSANFRTIYNTMPAYTNLVSIDTSSAVRLVINELANHWWGQQHSAYVTAIWGDSPKETLAKLKSLLLLDDPPIGYLYIKNNNGSGAHAVVPYRVRKSLSDNIFYIDVYDNSHPTDDAAQIEVDTSAGAGRGTWNYPNWPGWGGDSSMLVMDPAGSYLLRPVWPSPSLPSYPAPATKAGVVLIAPALTSAVEIGDGIGHRMGYRDSVAYNDIPGARPDIPPTGSETPPYSYLVPEGAYSMTMDRFGGSAAEIFVFADAAIVHYRRTDADSSQTDRLSYDGGFSAVNPDPVPKEVNLSMLLVGDTTDEKQFTLTGYTMAQNDSVHLAAVNGDHLRFVNAGGASGYGLHLLTVADAGTGKFIADGLTIGAGSAHVVSPDWNDLDVVPIYIDQGNDGSIDDSMLVGNLVEVGEDPVAALPTEFSLGQNYPNPFNPSTTIPFAVPEAGPVRIAVYDVLGREVATLIDRVVPAGSYEVTWNAGQEPAGVYFVRMVADGFSGMVSLVYVR